MTHNVTEHDILAFMRRPDYHPLKRRKLSRELGVSKSHYQDFVAALEGLVDRRLAVLGKGRCY